MARLSALTISALVFSVSSATSCLAAENGGDELSAYFRMIWGLLLVLGVMLIVYGLVRKRFSVFHGKGSDAIRVVEIKPIMPKKSICLVEVRGKELLLGIGNDNISLLADLSHTSQSKFNDILEQSRVEEK